MQIKGLMKTTETECENVFTRVCVCAEHTEGASVFVLELPPLVEAGLGRRLLLHFALMGHFG